VFRGGLLMDLSRAATEATPQQEVADAGLVQHPYRLELRGAPQSLNWPDRCANCGAAAAGRVHVAKAFYSTIGRLGAHRRPSYWYRIVRADIPLCASCAERHRASIPARSWFARHRTFLLNPVHIATIGSIALLSLVGPAALTADSPAAAWTGLTVVAVLGGGVIWTIGVAWLQTRPGRLPLRTDFTAACDFSQDVSMPFERERHIYRVRNKEFADALGALNADRACDADQRRTPWLALLAVAIILALAAIGRWVL
jgi:hypothetical protein